MNVDVLKSLLETFGPSGREEKVRDKIVELIKNLVDGYRVDKLGNLIAWKNGTGPNKKRVLFDAHMDQIGVVVTYKDENDFLRVEPVGGITPQVIYGMRLNFDGTIGVVGVERETSKAYKENLKNLDFDKMFVDIVTSNGSNIEVGSFGVYDAKPIFAEKKVMSPALDDRIGCAMLVELLNVVDNPYNDLYLAFSVQEEHSLAGASVEAFDIKPDIAVAVDVTASADTPKADKRTSMIMGKGPAIKVMDSLSVSNVKVVELLKRTAENNNLRYQMEVLHMGGTDAFGIERTAEGVLTGALSIPTRYIHTPSEVCNLEDANEGVKLMKILIEEEITF